MNTVAKAASASRFPVKKVTGFVLGVICLAVAAVIPGSEDADQIGRASCRERV